jgi:ABC-type branched-subunit amino acid transport system permease subunit
VEALITAMLGSAYTQILTFRWSSWLAIAPNGIFGRAEVKRYEGAPFWFSARCSRARLIHRGRKQLYVFVMATLALTAIVGVGLNVLVGLTGQVSFGP